MAAKKTPVRTAAAKDTGLGQYFQRVFALMLAAVGVTAVASFATIKWGLPFIVDMQTGGLNTFFYIFTIGAFLFSIWAQVRVFKWSPALGAVALFAYAAAIGFILTPMLIASFDWGATSIMGAAMPIIQAFVLAALMFACMALFGYKTAKDLSFLRAFLYIGMIGLALVAFASFVWPLGNTMMTIVCAIGVLVFAGFTAYDMQLQKRIFPELRDERTRNQMTVLGALHMYISFVALFQYILGLLNRR